MRTFFSRLFYFLFQLLVIAFILGLLSKIISPTFLWVVPFVGLAFPFIVLGLLAYFLYWLYTKNKKMIQPFILLVALFFIAPEFMNIFPKKPIEVEENEAIKVMSYNVRNFEAYSKENKEQKRDSIFSLIREQDPDVLCLQETFVSSNSFSKLSILKKNLNLPHIYFESGAKAPSGEFGVTVLSKHPITATKSYPFSSGGNVGTKVDIALRGDTVSVFNIHLESASIENKYYNYSDPELKKLSKQQLWQRAKRVTLQLKQAFAKKTHQAELIHKEIKATKHPVIVCGDFNDSPMSYAYQTVKGNLYDTFKAGDIGIGVTYPAIPFMRIDHILVSKEFAIVDHDILKQSISDHYPVVTELVLE